MKRIALLLVAALAIVANVAAQTPQQVLDKAVAALKAGGNIQASYAITGSQGRSSGTITMSGAKFRLLSNDMKCWYNGSAMWTYSVATGEVNITTPTQQDLQMTNPMAAAEGFKRNFHMWKAKGQIPGNYAIKLMPKSKSEISEVYLYISNGLQFHVQRFHPYVHFVFGFQPTFHQFPSLWHEGFRIHYSLAQTTSHASFWD